MVVIHQLHKSLHARFLRLLLGGVLADDFARVLSHAGDETVAVGAVASAVVEVLHDGGFVAGEAPLQEDDRLVWLEELHHFWSLCVCVCAGEVGS